MEKVNVNQKLSLFNEHWSPKIVGELNDSYVKLAKLKGEFTWHIHKNEDEMFYVIKGELVIRFRDKEESLQPGEFVIIPKGVEHMPVASNEVHVMLIELKTTLNTGDKINEKTKLENERI